MTQFLDLQALAESIGPRFAEGAAACDQGDIFVSGNYDILKEYKVFSALVPTELGGGSARHSAMCGFLRRLAHYCPSTALALSMHQHLVAAAVYHHKNGRPGRALLERVAPTRRCSFRPAPTIGWIRTVRWSAPPAASVSAPESRSAAVHPGAISWSPPHRSTMQKRAGRSSISPFLSLRRGLR